MATVAIRPRSSLEMVRPEWIEGIVGSGVVGLVFLRNFGIVWWQIEILYLAWGTLLPIEKKIQYGGGKGQKVYNMIQKSWYVLNCLKSTVLLQDRSLLLDHYLFFEYDSCRWGDDSVEPLIVFIHRDHPYLYPLLLETYSHKFAPRRQYRSALLVVVLLIG